MKNALVFSLTGPLGCTIFTAGDIAMPEFISSLQPYWLWLALAFMLLAIEVLMLPSGLFLCLGTAAALMGAIRFFAPGMSPLWALTLFSILLVLSSLFWWKVMRKQRTAHEAGEDGHLNVKTRQLIGYRAALDEDIKGGRGKLRVNDSHWPVEADADYPAGTRVEVVAVKGITLRVKSVES